MRDGYDFSDQFSQDSWLEEFIVEYVDDTMDACTRKSFEEYLTLNPVLALQIEEMRQMRQIMCGLNCGCAAPSGFQARLRSQVACELLKEQQMYHLEGYKLFPPRHFGIGLALVILVVGSFYALSSSSSAMTPIRFAMRNPQAALLEAPLMESSHANIPQSTSNSIRHQMQFIRHISSSVHTQIVSETSPLTSPLTSSFQLKTNCSCAQKEMSIAFK